MKKISLVLCLITLTFLMVDMTHATTYAVDDLGNSDDGNPYGATNTLRKCIRLANENPGPDTIIFGISGTIFPDKGLSIVDDETIIDASLQWDGIWPNGQPGITLDGRNLGGGFPMHPTLVPWLTILGANNCHIRGLFVMNSFVGIKIINGAQSNTIGGTNEGERNVLSGNINAGVWIEGSGTDSNVVLGNYIGTDVTGTIALKNKYLGVYIGSGAQSNIIGGATEDARNIISGNFQDGISIEGSGTDNNVISGNYIGTDVTGTVVLQNRLHGVIIAGGNNFNIIGGTTEGERNIIIGGVYSGVKISGNNNMVSGNYIGTDFTGTVALGYGDDGVTVRSGESNTIGGLTEGERNVISGNNIYGISVGGSRNIVLGNYVGTDVTGTVGIGNARAGIYLGGIENTVGGTNENERNIISGNGECGVQMRSRNNVVSGNYIGTDVTGNVGIGNGLSGIYISDGAHSNTVGGTVDGAGNIISNNGSDGVQIVGSGTNSNKISRNSIHNNMGLGINLENGGNDEIPAPSIAVCELFWDDLTISGTGAESNATVEFFKADSASSGEGITYLGNLIADGIGQISGAIDIAGIEVSAGDPVVATTTHTDYNTSEFSSVFMVTSWSDDVTAPSAITDLEATTGNSIVLTWTAPGDDGDVGSASEYIIRYNKEEITEFNWDDSWDIDDEPLPSIAGTAESMTISFYPGMTYYFAIKTRDAVPNMSGISNSPNGTESIGIRLYTGWNMVSVVCIKKIFIDDFLASLPQCDSIWTYDASISSWLRHVVGAPDFLNNLEHMGPGHGYWVSVTEDSSWDCSTVATASPSSRTIQKPPFLLYGKAEKSRTVSLRSYDKEITNYAIGSNPKHANYYVLEVPIGDEFNEGDTVHIYANGMRVGSPIELGGMGVIRRHDLAYAQFPNATQLFQNYPNPFNPETWIPYQLADESDVTITIYDMTGQVIRILSLGHKSAGLYAEKTKAAYWDGTNKADEQIASGTYFYRIQAGNFSAIRKLIARK